MTTTPAYVKYWRRKDGAIVAGVANGLGAYFGVDVLWVRISFVLLSVVDGLGVLTYIFLWVVSKSINLDNPPATRVSRLTSLIMALVAVAAASFPFATNNGLGVGIAVIAGGAVLTWFAYDRVEKKSSLIVIVLGATLVLAGVLVASVQWEYQQRVFGAAVGSVLLTIAGIGALVVPFGFRVMERLNTQREEKLLADERAEIAARLHDSVLQTLALIQKRATDAEEVRRLARSQERELRQWLFDPVADATVFAALKRACGEVEDIFRLRITPVTVGEDLPLTDAYQACVLAAREAMVNAAKHAGGVNVDVYAETFDGLRIYVRDRGPGFNLETIPKDRHGVRDSIIGRVTRVGGEVVINSTPDSDGLTFSGTEVEISLLNQ